ncbi:hypothetical protein DYB37_002735 [Aphanomyces astaci]|uniref:Enhancer of rudimentary homolog n=1 Tax=Aphanomyces astaci TaxID=112090 RepID=A0A3R6YRD9_APHAT|nr:hypothetical protein AaE_008536 [Aphanomyces astaci]RHY95712.1 hypothetical protein DYB35_000753 [Aphanomyces astaci]RHZ20724.1 hypothetical protein DYB26_000821 [Aphanomyces astaci]RHZ22215.1 hypothetical protein DYB37_002735 [Aphanomyces astaci]
MDYRKSKHTIILVQYTEDPNSRTYLDFESVNSAMDGVVKMYEAKLKQLNPNRRNITYDIQDLYNYIDSLADLSTLVYVFLSSPLNDERVFCLGSDLMMSYCRLDLETRTYLPCGKEWMKKKIFQVLRNQAQ